MGNVLHEAKKEMTQVFIDHISKNILNFNLFCACTL